MTDSFDPDDIEMPPQVAEMRADIRSFIAEYRWPLIILGGLSFTALVLSAVARRRGVLDTGPTARSMGSLEREVQQSADFTASLRHFAAAVDTRMQGFQQQLDGLHAALGTEGPLPEPTPVVNVGLNGAANQHYEAAIADQEENIPPGPASVSLP